MPAGKRPVWLFSMDSEQFCAPPLTTGALKACFLARGRSATDTDVDLVHFLEREDVERWRDTAWPEVCAAAREALTTGRTPVFGLSFYTWNAAEFLELARLVKQELPQALVVAGGPHVQRAEDFLLDEAIDVVVLGEGEETLSELLDCASREAWSDVAGCAFVRDGSVHRTPPRPRSTTLDEFPSALDVVPLRGADGRPLYKAAAYETSRGCPYRCSFCEWGTGAIGTKMYQFSLERIRRDLERLAAGGIKDLWLCDSNFGALREDHAKAEIVIELNQRLGLPQTFATSWSKNHNTRVQGIVRLLHRHGMLSHYHLALQTLTPLALELSHRTNMRANDYEPVVKSLAAEGVPVAAELIWGLPGETLAEFEANLDRLMTLFPNVNIFGYTLLPGTEFYDRRHEYRLETVAVAGYGKAKGEYVVGCHTFSRDEGEEGYLLIASYIVLARGQIMARTAQLLALTARVPVAALLRTVLRALLGAARAVAQRTPRAPSASPGSGAPLGFDQWGEGRDPLVRLDRIETYESRADVYLALLDDPEATYRVIRAALVEYLEMHGATDLIAPALRVLEIDRALCPRRGSRHRFEEQFGFDAALVEEALGRMTLPAAVALEEAAAVRLVIEHPGGVGEVLRDPDGGQWVRGRFVGDATDRASTEELSAFS